MGVFCTRGTGLVATSLWRAIDAGVKAARNGDGRTANDCARTLRQIADRTASPRVEAMATDGMGRISQSLTNWLQQETRRHAR